MESKPGPTDVTIAELCERFEELLLVFGLDAQAGIDDPQLDFADL